MVATLDELAHRHGTDKASGRHGFAEIYDALLTARRAEPLVLLEIGVKHGASVRMWREYFPAARVYGIDVKHEALEHAEERIEIFIGSQADTSFLATVVQASGPLDVVVDDGSHRFPDQATSLRFLWPHVRPGGLYIVEDTHTSYSDRYDMGLRQPETTVEMLKDIVDDVHARFHRQPPSLDAVQSVHFHAGTCVIEKRARGRRHHAATGAA